MLAPVIELSILSYEEMYILLEKLSALHSGLYGYDKVPDKDEMIFFLKTEYERIGAEKLITPREVIRDYIEVLDIIFQEENVDIKDLLGSGSFQFAKTELEEKAESESNDEYADFYV